MGDFLLGPSRARERNMEARRQGAQMEQEDCKMMWPNESLVSSERLHCQASVVSRQCWPTRCHDAGARYKLLIWSAKPISLICPLISSRSLAAFSLWKVQRAAWPALSIFPLPSFVSFSKPSLYSSQRRTQAWH